VVYIIVNLSRSEKFTEFYLLGPSEKAVGYPQNLNIRENTTVIIGLTNHEDKTINYTIEIWLVNETIEYNKSTNTNQTIYYNMWFMDSIPVTLNSTSVNTDQPWTAQWQQNYTFTITKKGDFKLIFLLFTTPSEIYNQGEDYSKIAAQKIVSAYREVYLRLSIQ
jgi:uncharacterized membrane protein